MQFSECANVLVSVLRLRCPPLAVRLLRPGETAPDEYDGSMRLRYCQALMMGRKGHKVYLGPENVTCPAAASAFGFRPLPEKIAGGDMLFNLGLFGTPSAAARTIALMPRLEPGACSGILVAPLGLFHSTPDVVVLEGSPEQLMWVTLADIFTGGGRHNLQTGVFQAACIDSTVVPFQTGRLNATLGCYGCRDSTDISEHDCLLGFPGRALGEIADSLERLSGKAIPRARAKGALRLLLDESDRLHLADAES